MVLFTTHAHTLSLVERALTSPQQQQSRVWRQRRDVSVALISCSFAFFSSNTQSTARARRDVAQPEAITKTRHTHTHTEASPKSSVRVCEGDREVRSMGIVQRVCKSGGGGSCVRGGAQMCRHIHTHTYVHMHVCIYASLCVFAQCAILCIGYAYCVFT